MVRGIPALSLPLHLAFPFLDLEFGLKKLTGAARRDTRGKRLSKAGINYLPSPPYPPPPADALSKPPGLAEGRTRREGRRGA